VLLTDKVPFRMHWPAYCGLHINSVSVPVTNRPGTKLLGANGRDEGPRVCCIPLLGHLTCSTDLYES
jgi:hypothetical protein